MTTNNTHITELCDQLVAAVRQDIRQELTAKLREEFGTGVATGMHGEPLATTRRRGERGKDKRPFRPNSTLAKLYRVLASRKTGVNIQTLARETGLTKKAVHRAVYKLRKHGYQIVVKREGFLRPKYKLAS